MKTLKFGLIGCSKIALKHAESVNRIPEAKLVSVCDIVPDRAMAFGKKYNVNWYTNYRDMLKNEEIDVVNILTPSGTHAEIAVEIATDYKKHIVVEKPMCLRLEDADLMITVCNKNKIRLFVVMQNRFNVPIRKLKEAIDKGRFGKLVIGTVRVRWCRTQEYYDQAKWRGTWSMDGGVLMNQAIHHIDMLRWMMGDVKSVMSATTRKLVNIEAEDTGAAILRFSNGALGIVEATTATRPEDLEGSISILGERGSVEIGGFSMNVMKTWNFVDNGPEDEEIFSKYGKNLDAFAWNHTEYLRDVVSSINLNKKPLVDGTEGKKSLELINALYESAETQKEIFLDSFTPKKCKLGARQN